MKLLRSFPILAFTLVLLSIAAVCLAQRSVGLLLVAGTLAAISWYVTEGPRGRVLPKWVSNILVIGFTLWVFAELFQRSTDILAVLGRYGVMLTLIKLYERRGPRDYAHLLTLSLVLMMTASLMSNDLLLGLMLGVYAALGLYVLLLYQLYAAFERSRAERHAHAPADYRLLPPLKPIMGRHPTLRFRGQSIGIGLTGAVLSVLVFVFFPRDMGGNMVRARYAGATSARGPRVAQFNWEVDLNSAVGSRITESTAKVLSVELSGGVHDAASPLYLRGAVLNEYAGSGRWLSRSSSPPAVHGFSSSALSGTSNQAIQQRVVLEHSANGVMPIFASYLPLRVSQIDAWRPGELRYDRLSQTLKTTDSASRVRAYTVVSDPAPPLEVVERLSERSLPTARPTWFSRSHHAILRQLADAQLARHGVATRPPNSEPEKYQWNRQVAQALTNWLHSSEFTYTTDLTGVVYSSPQSDPIIGFVTSSKRGHCEFFAAALAALCHSKEVPARVVVGYAAVDFDEARRQYTVRERNAHAWVEIACGESNGRVWSTFDPTPVSILEPTVASSGASPTRSHIPDNAVTDQFRKIFERLETRWNHNVVDFNRGTQGQLAASFNRTWSTRFAASVESVSDWMRRVNEAFYLGPAGYIWMGIVMLAIGIAVVALVKLMRRSLAIRRAAHLQHVRGSEYQRLLRHLGFYVDMLDVLRRAGMPKPDWEPPMQFAARLVASNDSRHGQTAEHVRRVTELFYHVRYGGRRLARQEARQVHQRVRELANLLNVRMGR